MSLISERMNDALNEQIGKELESAYIYLSMSMWLKEQSYNSLANWFAIQTQEEFSHAEKFANYIIEAGGSVKLPAIPAPKNDWADVKEIVETAYQHEQYITKRIHDLVRLAEELKEISVMNLLNWFVEEQIEEEANTSELVVKQARFRSDDLFDHHTKRKSE
ncbi:MAG: ferritin [Candidatus Thorarchaeota archaeon]